MIWWWPLDEPLVTWLWLWDDFLWLGGDFWMTFGWLSVIPLRCFATFGGFQMIFLMILVRVGWFFDEFTNRAVAARCRLGPSFLGSSGSVRGAFCVSFVTFWWLGGDFWMTFYDLVVTFGWLLMTWWWLLVDFLWRGGDFWMTFGWLSVTPRSPTTPQSYGPCRFIMYFEIEVFGDSFVTFW